MRSVQDVANDLNMNVGTLRKWTSKSNQKVAASAPTAPLPDDLPAQSWRATPRLQALLETNAMEPMQLHAWCREKGFFEYQLKARCVAAECPKCPGNLEHCFRITCDSQCVAEAVEQLCSACAGNGTLVGVCLLA